MQKDKRVSACRPTLDIFGSLESETELILLNRDARIRFKIPPHYSATCETMTQLEIINLIVVHHIGRAGSILLQSLFDGHPNVITLPSFSEIYVGLDEIILDSEVGVEHFIQKNPHIFDSARGYFGSVGQTVAGRFGPYGDCDLKVNIADFKEHMGQLIISHGYANKVMDRKAFFILLHLAYSRSIGNVGHSDVKYIVYNPHGLREFELLLRDFPQLRLMVMTRDPRQHWESTKKLLQLRYRSEVSRLSSLHFSFDALGYTAHVYKFAKVAEKLGPENLRVIDLPKLHNMGKSAMLDLCTWLGLEFHDSLLNSTFNGLAWMGNAANRNISSSLNPQFRENWQKTLSFDEIDFISSVNYQAIRLLHYEPTSAANIAELDDRQIQKKLLSFLSAQQTLRKSFITLQIQCMKEAWVTFISPLERRNSAAQYFRHVAGRALGFGRRMFELIGRMMGYAHFRDNELPEMLLLFREQQSYLELQRIPDEVFLTNKGNFKSMEKKS
jgi:hypothetical protein